MTPSFKGKFFMTCTVISCLVGCFALAALTIPLLILNKNLYRMLNHKIQGSWFIMMAAILEYFIGIKFVITGDDLPFEKQGALVMCNHRTRLDWMFLWPLWARTRTSGSMRMILKKSIKSIPVIGWTMQHFMYLFLARDWAKDRTDMAYRLNYLLSAGHTTNLFIFPEGTDLSERNLQKSASFAKSRGLPVYTQVLHPKFRGFNHCLNIMRSRCDAVWDITVGYVDFQPGERPNEFSVFAGRFPREVHLNVRRYPIASVPTTTAATEQWMRQRFAEKEQALVPFYAAQLPPTADTTAAPAAAGAPAAAVAPPSLAGMNAAAAAAPDGYKALPVSPERPSLPCPSVVLSYCGGVLLFGGAALLSVYGLYAWPVLRTLLLTQAVVRGAIAAVGGGLDNVELAMYAPPPPPLPPALPPTPSASSGGGSDSRTAVEGNGDSGDASAAASRLKQE